MMSTFLASSPAPSAEQTSALRDAATTIMLVLLLLIVLFMVIGVVMVVRRRRIGLANTRSDERGRIRSDASPDPWKSAGERVQPYDSRDVD